MRQSGPDSGYIFLVKFRRSIRLKYLLVGQRSQLSTREAVSDEKGIKLKLFGKKDECFNITNREHAV